MKSRTLIQAAFVAALVAAPALSFAQDVQNEASKSRAEVKAELIQLEKAGYNPATANDATYPSDIQAAEARVSQPEGMAQQAPAADTSGYGPSTSGSSQSGQPASMRPEQSIYFGN